MTDKKKNGKRVTTVVGKVIRNGHEEWRVASDGKIVSLTTRSSSTRAMDEAMVIYSSALQRLANR